MKKMLCAIVCAIVVLMPVQAQTSIKERMVECMQTQLTWRNDTTGVWESAGWWNSANVLTAVIRYARITNDVTLLPIIEDVYEKARHYKVGTDSLGNARYCDNFANDYYDDRGWWGLAWVDAYHLTWNKKYLAMAETIFQGMIQGWSEDLGGGIWWKCNPNQYKNAIANDLFGLLAARLYKATLKEEYRDWLNREVEWFLQTGMLNTEIYQIEDGLGKDGKPNRKQHYTYNQGVAMAVLTEMYELTHQPSYLELAEKIARATMTRLVTEDGVLREMNARTEPSADGVQFKGIFIRHLAYLYRVTRRPAYAEFIRHNAQSIITRNYDAASHSLGCYWYGPFHKVQSAANACALECLIEAEGL